MDYIRAIFANDILRVPLLAWLTAQLLKVFISFVVERRFDPERLFGDGGMPSGHSATVMALTSVCGWAYGFGSVFFAISAVVSVIVMHDATGVRRETGKQAISIKLIVEALNGLLAERDAEVRTGKLKELVGHSPVQVFCGGVLGVLVAVLYCLVCHVSYGSAAPLLIAIN